MREKLVSIGDDFWIENEQGEEVFKVDGKALRIKDTLIFEDRQGNELCRIEKRILKIKDTMDIEGPDGKKMAIGSMLLNCRESKKAIGISAPLWLMDVSVCVPDCLKWIRSSISANLMLDG